MCATKMLYQFQMLLQKNDACDNLQMTYFYGFYLYFISGKYLVIQTWRETQWLSEKWNFPCHSRGHADSHVVEHH